MLTEMQKHWQNAKRRVNFSEAHPSARTMFKGENSKQRSVNRIDRLPEASRNLEPLTGNALQSTQHYGTSEREGWLTWSRRFFMISVFCVSSWSTRGRGGLNPPIRTWRRGLHPFPWTMFSRLVLRKHDHECVWRHLFSAWFSTQAPAMNRLDLQNR